MTTLQRQESFSLAVIRALAAENPDAGWLLHPYPPSSLSWPVRNRASRLSDDRDRAVGKLPVSRDDVGRASLRGDEHPECPSSGTATVASPPPGGGRPVLDERAA